jgi:hypothetical protein
MKNPTRARMCWSRGVGREAMPGRGETRCGASIRRIGTLLGDTRRESEGQTILALGFGECLGFNFPPLNPN